MKYGGQCTGHIGFSGLLEFFEKDGKVYRARKHSATDPEGYRTGAVLVCTARDLAHLRRMITLEIKRSGWCLAEGRS